MVMTEDVIDAEYGSSSTALVQQPSTQLVRPIASPSEIAEAIHLYEETKRAILTDSDVQRIGEESFTKRKGWSKLAVAFGVSSHFKDGYPRITRDEDDEVVRAEAVIIAVAPNGRYAEGYGACSIKESRYTATGPKWRKKTDQRPGHCTEDDASCPVHYAHKGTPIDSARGKLDHDIPSTAETRARNRAYANLFGNGEVSAEEVSAGGTYEPANDNAPYESDFPKASPYKPASANQLATIAKLSRQIGSPEEPREDMTSAEASDRITELSRQYNERKGQPSPRTSSPQPDDLATHPDCVGEKQPITPFRTQFIKGFNALAGNRERMKEITDWLNATYKTSALQYLKDEQLLAASVKFGIVAAGDSADVVEVEL
jgi:hypothetical protein